MSVDMLVSRFFEEVDALYPSDAPFSREGVHCPVLAGMSLPSYRRTFISCLLLTMNVGYHLPSYAMFRKHYLHTLREKLRDPRHCGSLVSIRGRLLDGEGEPTPGLLHRMSGFYVDGMIHTHLCCVMAQAYDEERPIGAVSMDATLDLKFKTDILLSSPRGMVRVNIGQGSEALLGRRAAVEDHAKRKAYGSSEKGNPFMEVPEVRILSRPEGMAARRGLLFFDAASVDPFLLEVDGLLGIPGEEALRYDRMKSMTIRDINRIKDARKVAA